MSSLCRSAIVALLFVSGCGKEAVSSPNLRVDKLPPAGGGCHVTCQEHPSGLGSSPPLGDECPNSLDVDRNCGFAGGADMVRVIVDLGELDVDRQLALKVPDVTWLLDGVPSFATGVIDRSEDDTRTLYTVSLRAPSQQVDNFGVRVKFTDSFFDVEDGFDVAAPRIAMSANCIANACVLDGEKVNVLIQAPIGLLDQTQKATVQTWVGGVLQEHTAEAPLVKGPDEIGGTTLPMGTARFWVKTPPGIENPADQLKIEGRVGPFSAPSISMDLLPPGITLEHVGCTGVKDRCILGVDKVSVTLKGPPALAGKTATLKTFVDSVSAKAEESLPLTLVGAEARVTITLTAPPAGAIWRLQGVVDAYVSTPVDIDLTEPDMRVYTVGCDAPEDPCKAMLGVDKIIGVVETDKNLVGKTVEFKKIIDDVPGPAETTTLVVKDDKAIGIVPLASVGSGKKLVVAARVSPYQQRESFEITLVPPTIDLTVTGCVPGAACERDAGVGQIVVGIRAPADLAMQTASISLDLDGVPGETQSKPLQIGPAQDGSAVALATATFNVPDAACGDGVPCVLTVLAHVGAFATTPDSQPIFLQEPLLRLDVPSCPSPCQRKAGEGVLFALYAPAQIQVKTANLSALLGGALTGESTSLSLDGGVFDVCPAPQIPGPCRFGVKTVPVPATASAVGKLWSLRAQVGQASTTSADIEILPP